MSHSSRSASRSHSVVSSSSGTRSPFRDEFLPSVKDEVEGLQGQRGPSPLSREHQDLLLGFLEIDISLPDLGPPGIHSAYQKYIEIIRVKKIFEKLATNASWAHYLRDAQENFWTVTFIEFVDIFIAKSQYYKWVNDFTAAVQYADMSNWLKDEPNRLSNKDLWGHDDDAYTFAELRAWTRKAAETGKKKSKLVQGKLGTEKKKSGTTKEKLGGEKRKKKKQEKTSSESDSGSEDSTAARKFQKGKGKRKSSSPEEDSDAARKERKAKEKLKVRASGSSKKQEKTKKKWSE